MKKFNFNFIISFSKIKENIDVGIQLNVIETNTPQDLDFNFIKSDLIKIVDDLEGTDSGLEFQRIQFSRIVVYKKTTRFGGTFKEQPEELKRSQSTVNVKNTDNKCFLWTVLASVVYIIDNRNITKTKNRNRVSNYTELVSLIRMDNITYPVKVCDVEKINNMIQN
jgi:energy-coupling factor transporter ATP-binding protein EcfA2